MRTRALIENRITTSEKSKIKGLITKIFNIDHIWGKTEWNQVNNLFSLKMLFNSFLFEQPTQIEVRKFKL